MEVAVATIVVALIAGPLMWVLARFDKRNTSQHGVNLEVLNMIKDDVKMIRFRQDQHLTWHAEGHHTGPDRFLPIEQDHVAA